MKLDFKRIMSSVLAFVMLFSSLVMVNVVSVSAADGDFTLYAKDFMDGYSYSSSKVTPKLSTAAKAAGVQDTSFTNMGKNQTFQKYGTQAGGTVDNKSGLDFKDELIINPTTSINITANNTGTLTVYFYAKSADRGVNINGNKTLVVEDKNQTENDTRNEVLSPFLEVEKGESIEIKCETVIAILAIDFKVKDASAKTVEWNLDKAAVSTLKETLGMSGDITIKEGRTVANNTLSYSGTDYIIVPGHEFLTPSSKCVKTSDSETKTTYTVTPTEDMFKKAVVIPYDNIKINGGANRILHLKCRDNMVFSILLDDTGKAKTMLVSTNEKGGYDLDDLGDVEINSINLHTDNYTATMSGGTLTDTTNNVFEVTGDGENKYEATFKATEIKPLKGEEAEKDIDLTQDLVNASDVRGERLYGSTRLGGGYFRVVGSGYQNVYSISGDAEDGSFGKDAMAIVLRAANGGGKQEDGNAEISKGGIGFTVDSIAEGMKGQLTFSVQCIKDENSAGVGATLGLAKTTGSNTTEAVDTDVDSREISASEDSDMIETKNVTFDIAESGNYAVYNKGQVGTNGNIRIYSAKFEVVPAPKADELVDVLNADDLEGSTITAETLAGNNKFKLLPKPSGTGNDVAIESDNATIQLPGAQESTTINKRINTKGAGDKTKRAFKFTTGDVAGKIYVYALANADDKKTFTLEKISDSTKQTKDADVKPSSNVKPSELVFNIEANEEYALYCSGGTVYIYYIGSTVALKSLAKKKTAPTVEFYIEGAKASEVISIKKESDSSFQTIQEAGKKLTFDNVAPNTRFIIGGKQKEENPSGLDGVAPNNVYKWESINGTKSDIVFHNSNLSKNNYFVYTVPANANKDTTYGVKFTACAVADIQSGNVDGYSGTTSNTVSKNFGFGQYGFGDDKAKNKCGGNYVKNVASFQYSVPTMNDYFSASFAEDIYNDIDKNTDSKDKSNGVISIGNQHGILYKGDGNYVKFTIDSSLTNNTGVEPTKTFNLQIDRTGQIAMYEDETSSPMECKYISNSSGKGITKQEYTVTAGKTYTIKATGKKSGEVKANSGSYGNPGSVVPEGEITFDNDTSGIAYIKSLRMSNPNNIFDASPSNETKPTKEGTYSELGNIKDELELASGVGSVENTDTVFRVIGRLNITEASVEAALEEITAVGYDIYDKAEYDAADTSTGFLYHEGVVCNSGQPTLKGSITFNDVVNTAVDTDVLDEAPENAKEKSYAYGSLGDTSNLYFQTFFALPQGSEGVVLVPWVQYNGSASKVYSMIKKDEEADNNNHVLSLQAEEVK